MTASSETSFQVKKPTVNCLLVNRWIAPCITFLRWTLASVNTFQLAHIAMVTCLPERAVRSFTRRRSSIKDAAQLAKVRERTLRLLFRCLTLTVCHKKWCLQQWAYKDAKSALPIARWHIWRASSDNNIRQVHFVPVDTQWYRKPETQRLFMYILPTRSNSRSIQWLLTCICTAIGSHATRRGGGSYDHLRW